MSIIINGVDLTQGKEGKSAYNIAVENGYTGTLEEFSNGLIQAVEAQKLFSKFNRQLAWNDDETVYTETYSFNGDNYREVMTEVSDTQYKRELYINNVLCGSWTMIIDGNGSTTTYVG